MHIRHFLCRRTCDNIDKIFLHLVVKINMISRRTTQMFFVCFVNSRHQTQIRIALNLIKIIIEHNIEDEQFEAVDDIINATGLAVTDIENL